MGSAHETIEDMIELFGRNTAAVVAHANDEPSFSIGKLQFNPTSRIGEPQRIVHQIHDDATQHFLITQKQGGIGAHLHLKGHILLLGQRAHSSLHLAS